MNPLAAPALDLRDIHAAAAPSIWPPAPGWWLLAVLLLVVLLVFARWLARRLRQRRYKRQVLNELEQLSVCYSEDSVTDFITAQSTLMRRIALSRYTRERVASLTGSDWLRFLDATGGGGEFEQGVGRVLEEGPYRPHSYEVPAEELLALTRRWVMHNIEVAT